MKIIGSLQNFENLCFLILSVFHPPMAIPKMLVFHDSKQEVTNAAVYIESRLPSCLRNCGLVKHYHLDMSTEYLQQTFDDFLDPNGGCQILHVTAGAATIRDNISLIQANVYSTRALTYKGCRLLFSMVYARTWRR